MYKDMDMKKGIRTDGHIQRRKKKGHNTHKEREGHSSHKGDGLKFLV
jgi:hypothetical protein